MPDENDILYDTYGISIAGLFEWIAGRIRAFFGLGGDDALAGGGGGIGALGELLGTLWNAYSVIAIILSILFFWGFVYAKIRFAQISEEERAELAAAEASWQQSAPGATSQGSRWSGIVAHLASDDPKSWRLGLIEADIMLDEALTRAGFVGAGVGDKLKSANPQIFRSVQDAWDAHKVRNQIAHAGGDFVLTRRISSEALVKYERALRELGAI